MTQFTSGRSPENQPNTSGLEKIILLIAFIVIAAMFTYTALTTDLFSTEKKSAPESPGETTVTATNINTGGK